MKILVAGGGSGEVIVTDNKTSKPDRPSRQNE
jgi:hypothetical protein